jgi:hypothetical protein
MRLFARHYLESEDAQSNAFSLEDELASLSENRMR